MLIGRGYFCWCCSARTRQTTLVVTSLVLQLWSVSAASDFGVPANLTIRDSTPYAVCLTWTLAGGRPAAAAAAPVHLQLIYRPVNARSADDKSYHVIVDLLGHRRSATLDNLRPETQYRLVMTSSVNGSLLGTSPVIFFHTPRMPLGFVASSYGERADMLSAEEIGIIVIVLGVWMMAIMLFFNRWGKIRMLEPYEYNFKYHHPIPEVAAHRPSCPLADGAPLLQTSFDRHCSLDRRLAPYGRRCSSLSAYLSTEPRMIRNNSDPAPPPPQAGPARPALYRSSMQELRREPPPAGVQSNMAAQLGVAGRAGSPGQAGTTAQAGGAGVLGQAGQAGTAVELAITCRTGCIGQAGPAGKATPACQGLNIAGEDGVVGGDTAVKRKEEPDRGLLERARELVFTRELVEVRGQGGEAGVAPTNEPESSRRLNTSKPVRLVCCEADRDLVLDSEV